MSLQKRNAALKKYRLINERKAAKKFRGSTNSDNKPATNKNQTPGVVDNCDYGK